MPPRAEEPADLAAGREHAVARHDDRERIAAERLADLLRDALVAESNGNLAIGERRTRRDGARHLVDAAVERWDSLHIEPDGGEIGRVAAQ